MMPAGNVVYPYGRVAPPGGWVLVLLAPSPVFFFLPSDVPLALTLQTKDLMIYNNEQMNDPD